MSETPDSPPPRPLWFRLVRDWLLPIFAVLLVVQVVGQMRAPSLPEEAPPFTLRDLEGTEVSLADLRGQPVVLNFWATWCAPCRIEIPAFSRFARRHPDVVVIGIVADGPVPKVKKVAADLGVDYQVLMGDRATLSAYGISSFPTTVVLDRNGHVSSAHTGIMIGPQLAWATRGL